LGFDVTFWACAGMRTEICEATENFGEKIFRAMRDDTRTTLIFDLLNDNANQEILPKDVEYKNCPTDLTLTGI